MRRLTLAIWALLLPAALGAQWRELTVGSEAELYVRAMQTRGAWDGEPASIRRYGPSVIEDWSRDSLSGHPWRGRFQADSAHVWLLRPMVETSFNSAFPWGFNDGAIWQGRGANVAASVGFGARWRWFSLRVEPLIFRAQNAPFQLVGDTTRGANPFVDGLTPGSVDIPQRFGRSAYQRIDPGQSELRADVGPVAAGVSTMNEFWGPGIHNSLLLDANAAGFPHFFLGTSRALVTPLGRFSGRVIYGKLSESAYAPGVDVADRIGTGLVVVWQPPSGRGFEIGGARFYHRFWPAGGLRLSDLKIPFGSFFGDAQVNSGGSADNQLASVFARWRAEDSGFELFGEFGRTDRSADLRDLSLEPEHNSAWLLGFAKSWRPSDDELWMLRGEFVNGRVSMIQDLGRGQSTFYDHTPITQGHTEDGQLLGTPLLERAGGFEVGLDRWAPWGRAGLTIIQRLMPGDLNPAVSAATARSQWYTELSAVRFVGPSEWFAKAGMVFDLNRFPGRDVSNGYLQAGARVGF